MELLLGQVDGIRTQWENGVPFFQNKILVNAIVEAACIGAMMVSGFVVIISAAIKIWRTTNGLRNEARGFEVVVGKPVINDE